MRRLCQAAVAAVVGVVSACAAFTGGVAAGPFRLDDLLHAETLGAAAFDPSGRFVVYEQRDPYDSAPRFDGDQSVVLTLSRLRIFDSAAPGPGRPLIAGDPKGVVMGPFSPSGRRLAVYRVQGSRWRLGVVTIATRAVRWFGVTPEGDGHGRDLQWVDERSLLVLDRPDGRAPLGLHQGSIFPRVMPGRWAAAAHGHVSRTAYGSGAYLAVRDRGPPNRLLKLDAVTGKARVLSAGHFTDLELAPHGRWVALLEAGPDLQPKGDAPVRGPAGSETEASRLSVLNLVTGERRAACPDCDVSPELLSWSPDGRSLLVFARGPDGLWTDGGLMVVDPATVAAHTIGADVRPHVDLNPAGVWTAWMGETPLVFGRRAEPSARDDWWALAPGGPQNLTAYLAGPPAKAARLANPQGLDVLSGGGLWRVAPDGSAHERLSQVSLEAFVDLHVDLGSRLVRAPPTRLWLTASRSSGASLEGLDATGRAVSIPSRLSGGPWADASLDGHALRRSVDPSGVERLILSAGATDTDIAVENAGWARRDPPRIVAVQHVGPAGQPLLSWVFLPPRPGASAPSPLIVRPYPGSSYPQPPSDPPGRLEFYQNLRVLTGHGYAVLVPSLPSPPGGMVEPAAGLAQRILGVVQAALDTPALAGELDPARLAIMGHSFGGYAAMTAIAQTDCFKAAVEMNGISDLTAYWDSLPGHLQLDSELAYWSNWHTGVVERTQPELQVPPWRDPERYVRNSPIFAADRIHTPLLLIHGWQDGLSAAQSEAMYSALFRQGKDALLLLYWGEMHSPSSPGDVRDIYDQTFRFLDDHLALSGDVARSGSPGPGSASGAPRPPPPPPTGCPTASPPKSDVRG
jgi:dipeptidyl aminopeptidase/acylaminoacyl peptidase